MHAITGDCCVCSLQSSDFFRRSSGWLQAGPMHFSLSTNTQVMETLRVEGFDTCFNMYENLTSSVSNLQPYWDYVHCTKEALPLPKRKT